MLTEMETGWVGLIKASTLNPYIRTVDTLPDLGGDTFVKKLAVDAPAIYAVMGTITVDGETLNIRFSLSCVARNARGPEASRQGDGKIIGAYEMLTSIMALAHGATVGGSTWTVVGAEMMNDDKLFASGLSVGLVHVLTNVTLPAGIDLTTLSDFKLFDSQYDIPPFETAAEHQKWLANPADYSTSKPELQDDIQIQP